MHISLTQNSATAISQTLSGLGGIGKTQTAIAYAHLFRNDYKAVFWVKADTIGDINGGFAEIARLLDLPEKDAQSFDDIVHAVKRWLESNEGWLLIFDNADQPKLLKDFNPRNHKGHILLTSRAQVFHELGIAHPVELPTLPPDEAENFLFKRTGRDETNDQEKTAAAELAEELGYLPLALEQAAAFITEKHARFKDYLKSFRHRRLELLNEAKPVAGDYHSTIAMTWSLSFEEVERVSVASADLLRASAYLSPDQIPFELIVNGSGEFGPALASALADTESDPLLYSRMIEPLTRYSLVRVEPNSQTYSIHRLVQETLRATMDQATQRSWAERIVRALNRAFPDVERFENWPLCERFLPHAKQGARLIEEWDFDITDAAGLLNKTGYYCKDRAQYTSALPLYERALAIWEKALGADHPDVATSLNNLAELYRTQGNYEAALPLNQRALAIREKALGADHPSVATSLNNLAELYRTQGNYEAALPLNQRALAIREKALGADHPDVAASLNNLAGLYQAQGNYKAALPLNQRALAISEKALGADHPSVAASLNNLVELYESQGNYEAALPLNQRALAIREKALGADHPDFAMSLNNLAELYRAQGNYEAALHLNQRALAILEKALGADHPDVATSLNNLAELYGAQGNYEAALPLQQRDLAISEKALGADHPHVAMSLNNLAGLYQTQGNYEAALPLYKRALAIWEKALGDDHPNVATGLKNYASLLRAMNRPERAKEMEDRAKAIRGKRGE